MTTQDSQRELRNAIEAYKRYPYGTKEFPHITGIELLEVVEVYVTTRVKEAERLARINELDKLPRTGWISNGIRYDVILFTQIDNRKLELIELKDKQEDK